MKTYLQLTLSLVLLLCSTITAAQAPQVAEREYPEGYITGVVTSENGPEAGVWVIAETDETNTPYVKIVVTDDDGRYTLPQMPEATYNVWVRGYGLIDSAPIEGRPGDTDLALTALVAPNEQEAAKVYPADYWFSLLEIPTEDMFPGTGPLGNGFAEDIESQKDWVHEYKSRCHFCHQQGSEVTRTLDHMDGLGFDSHEEAWDYRLQLGVRGGGMYGSFVGLGREGMLEILSNWTRGIEAGLVPQQPPRPEGVERNVVVTLRDIGGDHDFMHDEISTDKNNPTVNANGPVYAVSSGHGTLEIVDPITNDNYKVLIPTRDDPREVRNRFPQPGRPSNFWGMEHIWGVEHPSDPHNPMMDSMGRVWMTSKIRNDQPDWCQNRGDISNKFAEYYPLTRSGRQASVYDPATGEFELIDTCFATHHLQLANNPDRTMYFNELSGPMFGWVDTATWDLTHDEIASQGWCPQIVDTNGDGVITKPWNEARSDTPPDPNLDTEVRLSMYSVIPDPRDGDVVWGASESYPGHIIRLDRGDNPPETCISEVYQVPDPGTDPRGLDIDSNGVVWAALAASSHFARFDRTKCAVLSGPGTEKGTHCEEGWTLFKTDGPTYPGTDIPADFHYYGWVDQHDVAGLGKDTPIITGSNSDSLIALDPETGDWTRMRVPYPLGFYQRGLDGRIDDPDAGWKGRSLWANYGTHLVWHIEGGKGTPGKVVQFQIRPDPLAH